MGACAGFFFQSLASTNANRSRSSVWPKVVAAKDAEQGLLSTSALADMREELSVSHIFIIDKNGKYIRSTNEDPSLISNAFSYCPAYQNLITGKSKTEATPIIPPHPEPKPYKFVYIPNRNRTRLFEVGTRVDFIAKTLTEALGSDSNIIALSLYAPNGAPFGRFSSKEADFTQGKLTLNGTLPQVVDAGDEYSFLTKVTSSHPSCCQCDVSGISKNGEYYYVLKSEISKKGLNAIQAATKTAFFFLALANLLFSFLLSRLISRRLVKNIVIAANRIRAIKETGDLHQRVGLSGKDEVSYLTNEFDHLLDALEESHRRVVEAERVQARVQATREVAHNIKSPVIAVEMMLPLLADMPQHLQKVFRNSVNEIKGMVERLSRNADGLTTANQESPLVPTDLSKMLEDIIHEKQVEYSAKNDVDISFANMSPGENLVASINPAEFHAVISNLVNNALESYLEGKKTVKVSIAKVEGQCKIDVEDFGRGIDPHVLPKLGAGNLSVGKIGGKGIGLAHAYRVAADCGGRIEVRSVLRQGTMVSVFISNET